MLARCPVSTSAVEAAISAAIVRGIAGQDTRPYTCRRKVAINQVTRINEPIAAITKDKVKWRGQ